MGLVTRQGRGSMGGSLQGKAEEKTPPLLPHPQAPQDPSSLPSDFILGHSLGSAPVWFTSGRAEGAFGRIMPQGEGPPPPAPGCHHYQSVPQATHIY